MDHLKLVKFAKHFFSSLLISILLLCCPVFAENHSSDIYRTFEKGDYIQGLSSFEVTGNVAVDGYIHILGRFDRVAQKYSCNIYLWAWKSLESSGYNSFDDAVKEMKINALDNTICIVYLEDSNEGYIHVGEKIVPDFNTAALTEVLCRKNVSDAYYRMIGVFDTLCHMIGEYTGTYVSAIYNANGDVTDEAIEKAILPLHKVFPGYICVDFCWESEDENSVLRRTKEMDYDKIYELWENKLDYYFQDAVYITYYGKSGKTFIDIGEQTDIKLSKSQIDKLESTFQPAENERDSSGFSTGVLAVTDSITNLDKGTNHYIVKVSVTLFLLFIVLILVLKKRRMIM